MQIRFKPEGNEGTQRETIEGNGDVGNSYLRRSRGWLEASSAEKTCREQFAVPKRGSIMSRQYTRRGFFMNLPTHGVFGNDKKGEARYGGSFEPRFKCFFPLG